MAEKVKKPRRGRGEGSIRYLERIQKYEVRFSVGVDLNGKPIVKHCYFKKKSDALAFMRDSLSEVGKGLYVDPSEFLQYL